MDLLGFIHFKIRKKIDFNSITSLLFQKCSSFLINSVINGELQ